jgi:outer membrane porin, OprD family
MNKKRVTYLIIIFFPCASYASANKEPDQKAVNFLVSDDPFFTHSHMTLSLKNLWKYLKEENENPKEIHNAWGQGIEVGYQSGYFSDLIGIDANYYGAINLGASDYFNSRGVLYNSGTGNHKENASGFSKFGQRNIKIKHKLVDMQFEARWGWQTIKNLGVISNSTRLSPTTYSGWTGSLNYDALTLRGAYIDSSMPRSSPDKTRFQSNAGNYINHIFSGDISWKTDILNMQYAYGESENYLRRHIIFTSLTPTEKLKIGAQLYGTYALDEYKSMPISKRYFDKSARHYAIDATWTRDLLSSKWGIGYTEAKKENEIGFYPRHMSKNSRGTFISMAYAGDDYLRDGELVLSNISDYMLAPDFAVGVAGNIAQFNYKGHHIRTGEINIFTRWLPSHPKLKGLSVWTMFGPGWSYKSKNKTPLLNNHGHSIRTQTFSSEIAIEYKFSMF